VIFSFLFWKIIRYMELSQKNQQSFIILLRWINRGVYQGLYDDFDKLSQRFRTFTPPLRFICFPTGAIIYISTVFPEKQWSFVIIVKGAIPTSLFILIHSPTITSPFTTSLPVSTFNAAFRKSFPLSEICFEFALSTLTKDFVPLSARES
jgi:hypothetical protein